MKNYRDQSPPISCINCLHSYDVDFFEGCNLRCCEDFEIPAVELAEKRRTDEYDEECRLLEYDETWRTVFVNGICELYEKK